MVITRLRVKVLAVFFAESPSTALEALKDIVLELEHHRSIEGLLPLIVRRLVEGDNVALARIWLLAPGDQCATCQHRRICDQSLPCLHLVASAARSSDGATLVHSELNGNFWRIPQGAFKVGMVAAQGRSIVVTDPQRDPKIRRPDWIRAEGVQGFVGQPLICRGQRLGVLGVFVRQPVTQSSTSVLRILAEHAAAAIATARAFEQVDEMRRQLQAENAYLREVVADRDHEMVGESAAMAHVRGEIQAVAPTHANVLILGESGTGKELVARAVHRASRRAAGPLIEVNCASVVRELAESEFFGHTKGAFSGAIRDRAGWFEAAEGGTLFLDEIAELPLELQGKLLRVLQEGRYARVGETRTRDADVRIVAATNRDLKEEVAAGRFREDLFYRLNVFPIRVPPLRDRAGDMPALAGHLLAQICRAMKVPPVTLDNEQLGRLQAHTWPGNVRELRNVLERAVIVAASRKGPVAVRIDASTDASGAQPSVASAAGRADAGRVATLSELRERERENIAAALDACGGRVYGPSGAAALLGVKPTTLASRIKRYGLAKPKPERS